MIYLIDPMQAAINPCPAKCVLKCDGVCGIKPCYGIDPTPI